MPTTQAPPSCRSEVVRRCLCYSLPAFLRTFPPSTACCFVPELFAALPASPQGARCLRLYPSALYVQVLSLPQAFLTLAATAFRDIPTGLHLRSAPQTCSPRPTATPWVGGLPSPPPLLSPSGPTRPSTARAPSLAPLREFLARTAVSPPATRSVPLPPESVGRRFVWFGTQGSRPGPSPLKITVGEPLLLGSLFCWKRRELAPRAPDTAAHSQDTVDAVLQRLHVTHEALEIWTEKLRQWMAESLLKPLVEAMDRAADDVAVAAQAVGLEGIRFSQLGVPWEAVEKVSDLGQVLLGWLATRPPRRRRHSSLLLSSLISVTRND